MPSGGFEPATRRLAITLLNTRAGVDAPTQALYHTKHTQPCKADLDKGSAECEGPELCWRGMQGLPNEQIHRRQHLQGE